MLRVVLAAAVTVALLATAVPAIENAQADRASTALDADAERIARAVESLAYHDDPTPSLETAPRRTVTVSLPARSWAAADLSYVSVGGRPGTAGSRPVVAYAFPGGPATERRLSLPVPLRTPDGPIVLREAGSHTLSFSFVTRSEGTVVVRRVRRRA